MAQNNNLQGNFKGKDILSLDQFDQESLFKLFSVTSHMAHLTETSQTTDILRGTLTTLIFFEPSSRTFGSFAAAIKRLGGQTLEFQNPAQTSSAVKGESLEDSINVFASYSDLIVVRHPQKGSVEIAAVASESVPVINAGDGIGEHPTQALLDLYTIYEKHGRLNNLTLVLAGDMRNGRTVHSLLRGLSLFPGNTVYLLSPEQLKISNEDFTLFQERGLSLIETTSTKEIPKNAHAWYWTRVQKERIADLSEYEEIKHSYILSKDIVTQYAGEQTIFMHPLPRVGEITTDVDKDERAVYLRSQVKNGMYTRMALVALVLGKIS